VTSISVINYGVGNLHSIKKGLEKAGSEVKILSDVNEIKKSDAIVLPGVGAFAEAKKNLYSLQETIIREANNGKPLLGICLGLQLFFTRSFEGGLTDGLNILQGDIVKLPTTVKLPQIGWNTIEIQRPSLILDGISDNSYMYFVHSYYAKPDNLKDVVAITDYGVTFPSIFEKDNIIATQFHPEKSGKTGLTILKNYVDTIKK
jgi:glutamine amidotransferase